MGSTERAVVRHGSPSGEGGHGWDKGRTRKQIGHSMAPRYMAASGCRIASFEFVLTCPRLCERLEDMLPVSTREDEASAGESESCGGSFLCARICSSSHDSS